MRKLTRILGVLGVSVGALTIASPAQANLIGDTVEACVVGPFPLIPFGPGFPDPPSCPTDNLLGTTPVTAMVGPGVEFSSAGVIFPGDSQPDTTKHIEVDVAGESFTVTISHDDPNAFNFQINGFEVLLSDLDWTGPPSDIVDVALVGGNTLPDPSSLTWTADSVSVVFPTFLLMHDDVFSATFALRAQARVPEPATVLLVGLGLLGVGSCRRRRTS